MSLDLDSLASELIAGRRLTRADDLAFLLETDLRALCESADRIRAALVGDRVDLCAIIAARGGGCPEDCKYCAQSARNRANFAPFPLRSEAEILAAFDASARNGVDRFSLVTSGRALTGEEFERALRACETMRKRGGAKLCASMGFLTKAQLELLRDAGVSSYHCNIETSRRYFPSVCSTHSFDQKLAVLERVKEVGLRLCSGGIVGMGETWEDRIDMALTLAEYRVDSIPINVLIPIEGTPFENLPRMTEPDILRTVAIFRWLNPSADIRLAAGRGLLPNSGEPAFRAGASATIVGDMLSTEACASIRADRAVLDSLGRDLKPLPTLN